MKQSEKIALSLYGSPVAKNTSHWSVKLFLGLCGFCGTILFVGLWLFGR